MTRNLDPDALLELLVAVVFSWARDARKDTAELSALAAWLGMEPAALRARLSTSQTLQRPLVR